MFDTDSRDRIAAIARGPAGVIPFAGGLVAEVVNTVIPGQRLDRVIGFLRDLDARVERMIEQRSAFEARLKSPEGSDLLEQVLLQASRAVSAERRGRLANLIANGLSGEQPKYDRTKKLLSLLNSVNDSELVSLSYFSQTLTNDSEWHRKLRDQFPVLLRPASREVRVSDEERERRAIRDSYERTTSRIGFDRNKTGDAGCNCPWHAITGTNA